MSMKKSVIICLLLLLATFAVFQHVPAFDFVNWDDAENVYNNPHFYPVTLASVTRFWTAPYNSLYTPLTDTVWAGAALVSRWMQPESQRAGGMSFVAPDVFHTLGLCVHLANVILVYFLLRRFVNKEIPAAVGALFFGTHPLQVESIAWTTGMNNSLAGFFGLISLLFYARWAAPEEDLPANPLHVTTATIFYLLACLCKPTATALPFVVLVLEIGLFRREPRRYGGILVLWVVMAAGMILATRQATDSGSVVYLPLLGRPFIVGHALAFYLSKLFVPTGLCPDYGNPPQIVLAHWGGYAAGLLPLSLGIVIVRWRLRWIAVAFGIFIAGALPVLGIAPFYLHATSTVGDRYVYLSLLGPSLAIAWLLTLPRVASRPIATYLILTLCFSALFVIANRQAELWKNSNDLFVHTIAVNPQSSRAMNNLGTLRSQSGDTEGAVRLYRRSLALNPLQFHAQYNLGSLLLRTGKTVEAIPYLLNAERLSPSDTDTHLNLGIAFREVTRYDEAKRELQSSLQSKDSALAHYQLGLVLEKTGDKAGAIRELRRSLEIKPDFELAQKQLGSLVKTPEASG
jgi:predicted TPR repeat methyltransferase